MPKWDELTPRQRDVVIGQRLGLHVTILTGDSSPAPHYTTDPAAALQLAEAMRQKGYHIWLLMQPGSEDGYAFRSDIAAIVAMELCAGGTAAADTLAEAIAHAAFLALGGEE